MGYNYEIFHMDGKFHSGYASATMAWLEFGKLDKDKIYMVTRP